MQPTAPEAPIPPVAPQAAVPEATPQVPAGIQPVETPISQTVSFSGGELNTSSVPQPMEAASVGTLPTGEASVAPATGISVDTSPPTPMLPSVESQFQVPSPAEGVSQAMPQAPEASVAIAPAPDAAATQGVSMNQAGGAMTTEQASPFVPTHSAAPGEGVPHPDLTAVAADAVKFGATQPDVSVTPTATTDGLSATPTDMAATATVAPDTTIATPQEAAVPTTDMAAQGVDTVQSVGVTSPDLPAPEAASQPSTIAADTAVTTAPAPATPEGSDSIVNATGWNPAPSESTGAPVTAGEAIGVDSVVSIAPSAEAAALPVSNNAEVSNVPVASEENNFLSTVDFDSHFTKNIEGHTQTIKVAEEAKTKEETLRQIFKDHGVDIIQTVESMGWENKNKQAAIKAAQENGVTNTTSDSANGSAEPTPTSPATQPAA